LTIDAYKTLFTNSVTFGIKKQLRAEQGIPDLEDQVQGLEAEKTKLEPAFEKDPLKSVFS
jgi:hypothetical protein